MTYKTSHYVSEIKHAKRERLHVKNLRTKPIRKAAARADRRAAKHALRDLHQYAE